MPAKQIHVLIIPSWYPQSPSDIGGSFFREQALALKKRGLKVGVIAPNIRPLRDFEAYSKSFGLHYEDDEGLPTYRYHMVNIAPKMPALAERMWVIWGMKLFHKYKEKYGLPDIIHVHSLDKAGFLAYKIFQKYNIPYIITEHSTAFARGLVKKDKQDRLFKVVTAAKNLIAVSQPFSVLLNNTFIGAAWKYVPNIVSDCFLNEKNNELEKKGVYSFINICMLTGKKKVDNLVKAFHMLSLKYPNLQLKIGGDGNCKTELKQLVESLELTEKVFFLGALSRSEVLTHIKESDTFVLSSEYETFGVVLIEALAMGKTVVATRCGGPESIVNKDVGVLVEKNSIQALHDGMEYIYKRNDDFKPELIKEYCNKNFSEEAVSNKLIAIYQHVLS